jgi:hypothetical protein
VLVSHSLFSSKKKGKKKRRRKANQRKERLNARKKARRRPFFGVGGVLLRALFSQDKKERKKMNLNPREKETLNV